METIRVIQILISQLDDDTHIALRDRTQQHGRSLEDEAKAILVAAVSRRRKID
jgi:plasmid stability protein